MKEKTKGQRSLAVLIVAVIVVALIGIVLPLSASAADLTDSQTQLAEAYCDFFNEMCKGNGIGFLTIAVTDIPLAWFDFIVDVGDVLWVGDDIYYYLVGDDLYMSRGGTGGRESINCGRGSAGGRVRDNLHVTGDFFADICTQLENQYSPKNTATKISWRNDKRWSEATGSYSNSSGSGIRLGFFQEGTFCNNSKWNEVYLVPFYINGSDTYHSINQYHYWQELTQDEDGNNVITLYVEYWNALYNEEPVQLTVSSDLVNLRYFDISVPSERDKLFFTSYETYASYLSRNGTGNTLAFPVKSTDATTHLMLFYSLDLSSTVSLFGSSTQFKPFKQTVSAHDESCTCGGTCDIGYYCSNVPIEMDYGDVDFSQFTAEDTVTLSGDTIYDYTITNNITGDSTTVNNYITNNYNYPDTGASGDSGAGSGSSSTIGGNVLVSGAVDVGGQIDVNLNIEQSGSGSSSDFLVPVDDYAQYLPEVAPEVNEYLETTYSFLPPEIVGLLIGGIGAAILCRILGR